MIRQAYAAVMAARNHEGIDTFNPATLEQHFETEELRRRVYELSLTQTQLIIAENDRRAEENVSHLMDTILCPDRGYEDHAFSITPISQDIERYLDAFGSHRENEEGFYLIGGWIFVQRIGFPFVDEKFGVWSGTGKTQDGATRSFLERFDRQMPMKYALRLGYALRCRHVPVQELMEQYVFQSGHPAVYH